MKTQHTQGKWNVKRYSKLELIIHTGETISDSKSNWRNDKRGSFVCSIRWDKNSGGINAEDEANARLIAAAPDLLSALERWQDEWVVNGTPAQKANNYAIEQQIQTAINKAKGGNQ